MSDETTTATPPAEATAPEPSVEATTATAPVPQAMTPEQAVVDKGAIDSAFANAGPAPDFREPPAVQAELLPVENMKRKITRMTLELPVHFTDEQQIEEGDKLATLLAQVEEIEEEKTKAMKGFKEDIDGLYVQIQAQAKVVKAKGRDQIVNCEEVVDYVGGMAITMRLDTMEEVKRRPLERAELQQELALVSRQETKRHNVISGKFGAGPWNNPAYGQNAKPGDTLLDTGISAGAVAEALMALDGVTMVEVYENETNEEDEDKRPPKCVEIMIDGGDGMAIAKKIMELLPIGVRLHGNTLVNVERENDYTRQVLFSRPAADAQPLELNPDMVEGAAATAGEGPEQAAPEADDGGLADTLESELQAQAAADLESEHADAMDAHDAADAAESERAGDALGELDEAPGDAAAGHDGDGF